MPLPSARPGDAPPRVNIADFKGDVLLFGISGLHRNIQTQNGISDALRGFIVPISGNHAGEYFTDLMVFSTRPVGRLRDIAPGTMVAGLVTQGEGRNAPADFEPLSAEWQTYADQKIAEWDVPLTQAMRQAVEDFHKWEANRKDRPVTSSVTMAPAVPSGPTVPNSPPPTTSSAGSIATTPQAPPNGPPTSSPAAGPAMPAIPTYGTEGAAASPEEAGF